VLLCRFQAEQALPGRTGGRRKFSLPNPVFWPNFGDLSAKPIFKNSGLDNSADFQKNQLVSSYFLDLHPTTSSLLKFQVPKEQTLMW
jgi:hypothetical protein